MSAWWRALKRERAMLETLKQHCPMDKDELMQALGVDPHEPLLRALLHVLLAAEHESVDEMRVEALTDSARAYRAGALDKVRDLRDVILQLNALGRERKLGTVKADR